MIIIAALTASLAVFVAVYALTTPARTGSISNRLGRWEREGTHNRDALLAMPFAERVGKPVVGRFQSVLGKLLPTSMLKTLEDRLMRAGEPVSLQAFLVIQTVAVAGSVACVYMALAGGGTGTVILLALAAAVVVGFGPLIWLRSKVTGRRQAILKALPDAVDLIVTTVEAGLAIDAALAEVGHETKGPLGEELRLTVRETTLGRSRRDALLRLIDRTQVAELRTFVQAIIQAEQTGVPIGQVLRTQAAQIRLKKRQWAEAEAQRAPIKMIVILIVLVLPSMLLMLMGPAVMRMQDAI